MSRKDRVTHGSAIFCDDVRDEVGNKQSYMGIYRGELILGAPVPAVLPKFVVVVSYTEPATTPIAPLTIRIYFPGQVDGDDPAVVFEVPVADTPPPPLSPDIAVEDQMRQLLMPLTFAPFPIEKTGRIRVHIVRDGEVFRLNSLTIRAPDASSPANL